MTPLGKPGCDPRVPSSVQATEKKNTEKEVKVLSSYRLVGLVLKASASRAADLGFDSHFWRDLFFSLFFFRSSHISDLKTGTPVANVPGACRYRVSPGTDWPCVSIL